MANIRSAILRQNARGVCKVCGRASAQIICEACSIRIRAEALVLKKHKDRGEA